jgi:hypothetical protein
MSNRHRYLSITFTVCFDPLLGAEGKIELLDCSISRSPHPLPSLPEVNVLLGVYQAMNSSPSMPSPFRGRGVSKTF